MPGIQHEDVREDLKQISKTVEGVGRMIGSVRVTMEDLTDLSEALRLSANSLDIYQRILKSRFDEAMEASQKTQPL